MYGYEQTHNRVVPYTIGENLEFLWQSENIGNVVNEPTVDKEGNIYTGTFYGGFAALDKNGKKRWKFGNAYPSKAATIAKSGNLYYSTADCNPYVYALNSTGAKLWGYDLRQGQFTCGYNASVTGTTISYDNSTIYLGSDYIRRTIIAFDLNGGIRWETFLLGEMPYHSAIAVAHDGTLFVGSGGSGGLFAIASDGKIKWDRRVAPGITVYSETPVIGPDNNIYITAPGSEGEVLASFSPEGTKRWSQTSVRGYQNEPVIKGTSLYIAQNAKLLALDSSNGNILWSWDSQTSEDLTQPVIDATGTIFTSTSRKIYAITPSGETKWSKDTPLTINQLVIAGDDLIYTFHNDDVNTGYIVAFGSKEKMPEPFLELPWNYEEKGLSFNDAALSINSFFDHEYPLLSSGVGEPIAKSANIMSFLGPPNTTDDYSSHDGYDYGKLAKANMGDPVLAAASGWASYLGTCDSCGNAILIDHGNGYQTRYYHLLKDGLITTDPNQKIQVKEGQQIGKVGSTGKSTGAHIHFMVVQDKDGDGNFENNLPDGVTDPFGWQSRDPDPWPNYSFLYDGKRQQGNKSFYLWKNKIDGLDTTLTANQAVFQTGRYTFDFPAGSTDKDLKLEFKASPIFQASESIVSLFPTVIVEAFDFFGELITQLQAVYTITVDFTTADFTRFKEGTMSFYSSADGINWVKEVTELDLPNKKATTKVDHMTYFALMAERKDTIAPNTQAILNGQKGQDNWFRSDVEVVLNAQDNEGGLGIDYTLYKIGEEDWEIYTSPLQFQNEGHYKIQFYSADKDENLEEIKSVEFDIDKTLPEAQIITDLKNKNVIIKPISEGDSINEAATSIGQQITLSDKANNQLRLVINKNLDQTEYRFRILKYNQDSFITLESNKLTIKYPEVTNLSSGESSQKWEIKNKLIKLLQYNPIKNTTKILTKEGDGEWQKEEKEGLVLLQLFTDKGTLKYSY